MGNVVGCDVSKGWIDIEVKREGRRQSERIANRTEAIKRFAEGLPAGSSVGMEATGRMHELLADTLHALGHRVFVINPRWLCNYRRSLGIRGKTDRSDAAVIARFVAAEQAELHRYIPPTGLQRELRGLLLQRRELVKLKASTTQSLGEKAKAVIVEFNNLLKRLEQRIREIISSEPIWKEMSSRLQSEPGVGPVLSAYLVQVLSQIGFRNGSAFVAHTGLDPRPNESGEKTGRRRLSRHGDPALRSLFYLAAMTACRSPSWRSHYDAQRAKGLSSTAAYVVIARKLARIAFSIFKTGRSL